jgi:predicted  nucleic acid-binding Zn-ribbon protein
MTDLGLPSASKASTQQQDREKLEYPAGYAFMSKTEIRRAYDAILIENRGLKEKIAFHENEEIALRERIQEANKKISHYQNRYLNLLGEETEENPSIKHLRRIG